MTELEILREKVKSYRLANSNRQWSQEIRDESKKLVEVGVPPGEIAEAIGIHYTTVMKWSGRKKSYNKKVQFKEVLLTDKKPNSICTVVIEIGSKKIEITNVDNVVVEKLLLGILDVI
jgi:hypothetical protein